MATRKTAKAAQAAKPAAQAAEEFSEAEYAAAAANPDIVRDAGITNGMPPDEVRRRILAVCGQG